jgi:hypothetical protein
MVATLNELAMIAFTSMPRTGTTAPKTGFASQASDWEGLASHRIVDVAIASTSPAQMPVTARYGIGRFSGVLK